MATATIKIDQDAHPTQPYGVAGRARQDLVLASVVTLRSATDSGVTSWKWSLLGRPTGSVAVLSNPTVSVVTFTPDVEGSYLIRLEVNGGLVGEVAQTVAAVLDADGLRIPAAGEDTEANYLINGSPNPIGWHPALEAYLLYLRGLADGGGKIVYDVDFREQGSDTIADGPFVIDGKTWTASNIASRLTLAEIDDTGILFLHATGSSSLLAGADTAPRLSIALSSLIPDYDPSARYMFLVQWSWNVAPDAAGERFSVGLYSAAASPSPSSALRFAGATISYNATAAADTVTAERDNSILDTQSVTARVLGLGLDSLTELSVWKASSLPSTPAGMQPVIGQRATNIGDGGDYNIFNHSSAQFVMALAATGTTAVHAVLIERLRIIRR